MTTERILALIESGDALAATLQTLRLNPIPEYAHGVSLQLHAMGRESDKLAHELAEGVQP